MSYPIEKDLRLLVSLSKARATVLHRARGETASPVRHELIEVLRLRALEDLKQVRDLLTAEREELRHRPHEPIPAKRGPWCRRCAQPLQDHGTPTGGSSPQPRSAETSQGQKAAPHRQQKAQAKGGRPGGEGRPPAMAAGGARG